MKLLLASLLLATVAEASPEVSFASHSYKSITGSAKDSLKSVPPRAAPDLADQGAAFFVDVPIGSPNGSDAVNYKVAAIFIRQDKSVVVVDDLARWTSVIPEPGSKSPTTPAQSVRLDGKIAHLRIDGVHEALVDVAGAKFLGCVKQP